MSTTSIYGTDFEGEYNVAKVSDGRIWTFSEAFLNAVAFGKVPGHELVHKFGKNSAVGTTLTVISDGGAYQVPTSPQTLFATSTDANDTIAGSGARIILVEYLDSNFNRQTGTIRMAGTSQSTDSISNVLRVFRIQVILTGTYATSTASSQKGTITLHQTGGTPVWATLPQISAGFGSGQSLISAYTVPANFTAFLLKYIVSAASNQTTDVYFFHRENADIVTSPYPGVMRVQNVYSGVSSTVGLDHLTWEKYPEKTDMGFMAKVGSGNGSCSAEFEFLLIDNNYL